VVGGYRLPRQAIALDSLGQDPNADLDVTRWIKDNIQREVIPAEPLSVDLHQPNIKRQAGLEGGPGHGHGLIFRGMEVGPTFDIHRPRAHTAFMTGYGLGKGLGDAVAFARAGKEILGLGLRKFRDHQDELANGPNDGCGFHHMTTALLQVQALALDRFLFLFLWTCLL